MNKLQIILFGALAAMAYGILHDQITVRICPEYFTVAHPPLFHTAAPTLLALCWGAAATVGIGLAFGSVLALVSQSAGQPPYPPGRLYRRILGLLVVMGISAIGAGCAGFYLFQAGKISFPAVLTDAIPASRHAGFMSVWFAHMASYLVGFAGSGLLIYKVWKTRGRPMVLALYPSGKTASLRAGVLLVAVALIVWWRFFASR